MTGSSTEVNGKIAITFTRLIVVETAVTVRLLPAPDHSNVPPYQDLTVNSCTQMLMSMI